MTEADSPYIDITDQWLAKHGIPRTPCFSTVEKGWVPLLDQLVEDLVAMGWDKTLAQVKEKFGTLRFYADHTDAGMSARIREAERASARTCSECGAPGVLRHNRAWRQTLCDECDHASQAPEAEVQ